MYFLILKNDPVFLFRYSIREAVMSGAGRSAVARLGLTQLVIWALPLVVFPVLVRSLSRLTKQRSAPFLLQALILLTAQASALSVIQACSPYQTNYSYGEQGAVEMNTYLRSRLEPGDRVLATKDVLYRLGRNDPYLSRGFWQDKILFLQTLSAPATRFLVISIPSQSASAYRKLFLSPETRAILDAEYDSMCIGTFRVYERRRGGRPPAAT
jgi:hypothetical protein